MKNPTLTTDGVTFHIKGAKRLESFDNLVKTMITNQRVIRMLGENGFETLLTTQGEELKYSLYHKYQDSGWMPTNELFTDLATAVRRAAECAKDSIVYGMTQIREANTNHPFYIVEFPAGGGKPCYVHFGYADRVYAALEQKVETNLKSKDCPDCKDGFYYPLFGPKEPCQTCCGGSQITVKSSDQKISEINAFLHEQFIKTNWKSPNPEKKLNTGVGVRYTLSDNIIVPANSSVGLVIDKLTDRIADRCSINNSTKFCIRSGPNFDIKINENGDRDVSFNIVITCL